MRTPMQERGPQTGRAMLKQARAGAFSRVCAA